ncbi:hypothetical protein ACWCQ0_46925 [Streptomyces massasporeus]
MQRARAVLVHAGIEPALGHPGRQANVARAKARLAACGVVVSGLAVETTRTGRAVES